MTVTSTALSNTLSWPGASLSERKVRVGDSNQFSASLQKGAEGELSTRTSNSIGIFTVSEGHNIFDGDYVDVYWDGGYRLNCLVTEVTRTTIAIDNGSPAIVGSNLPVLDTVCVVALQEEFDVDDVLIGEANAVAYSLKYVSAFSLESKLQFFDGSGSYAVDIPVEGKCRDMEGGEASPLPVELGGLIKVVGSNRNPNRAGILRFGIITDSES